MPNTSGSSYGITHNGSNGGVRFTLTNTTIDPGQNGAVGIYISGSTTTAAADTDGLNELILNGVTVAGYQSAVETKFTDVTIDTSTLVSRSNEGTYTPYGNGPTTAGDAAAVSEVTVTFVGKLLDQGVETVSVQVEENVTLELGIAKQKSERSRFSWRV